MTKWYMLTLIGNDNTGIVAKISEALYQANCILGEASMNRLGNSFTIMVMIGSDEDEQFIRTALKPVCDSLKLHLHLDQIDGILHDHPIPNALVTVSGADRAGIVSEVTNALYKAGLAILDLNSNVAGTEDKPIYIMQIEGFATQGTEKIEQAINLFKDNGLDIHYKAIDTMVG